MIDSVRRRRAQEAGPRPSWEDKVDDSGVDLIRRFYQLQRREVANEQIDADRQVYDDLLANGYAKEEILHAVGWTASHIPTATQFKMVKLCIAEALESRSPESATPVPAI